MRVFNIHTAAEVWYTPASNSFNTPAIVFVLKHYKPLK